MTTQDALIFFILGIAISEVLRYLFGFHSFFKKQKKSWVGFDLDGTLATTTNRKFDPKDIGEPVPQMIELVKKYLDEGKDVKIFTARVSTNGTGLSVYNTIVGRRHIKSWARKHIGKNLEIVCMKDSRMSVCYDDLSVQVKQNTGELIK
jgi:uncharacterized protein with NRDE domain